MLITKNAAEDERPDPARGRAGPCVEGLKTTAQKSVISARLQLAVDHLLDEVVAGRRLLPGVGHDDPDRREDRARARPCTVEKKCIRGETRSQPKTSTARKPDSRKKAKMPSAARARAEHVADVARVGRPSWCRTGTP